MSGAANKSVIRRKERFAKVIAQVHKNIGTALEKLARKDVSK